jgi:hypothetical protein
MGIERRMFKGAFLPSEVVALRQTCFTPGRVFEPGKYLAGDLPIACRLFAVRVLKLAIIRKCSDRFEFARFDFD